MKIVVAPNSFKETLTAKRFIEIVKREARGFEVIGFPLSDGGDGFIDCVSGKIEEYVTTGPDNKRIRVKVKRDGDTYYVESASVLGLRLLAPEERNPKKTTSYGLGMLIRKIVKFQPREIVIGFGGSSTVEFGIGALSALGIKFLDAKGKEVPHNTIGLSNINRIDNTNLLRPLRETKITCACDVDNVASGVMIYAPQKGADEDTLAMIRQGIENIERLFGTEVLQIRHGGASGGIPLLFNLLLGAELVSGAEFLIRRSGFIEALSDADLVITGEGKIDDQTRFGKIPYNVAKLSREHNIPVMAVVGEIGEINSEVEDLFTAIFSIATGPGQLRELMATTEEKAARLIRQVLRMIRTTGRRKYVDE